MERNNDRFIIFFYDVLIIKPLLWRYTEMEAQDFEHGNKKGTEDTLTSFPWKFNSQQIDVTVYIIFSRKSTYLEA